eukprot:scaffold2956_cov390-Prasinococcus_capsulatus_cf.AAC.5
MNLEAVASNELASSATPSSSAATNSSSSPTNSKGVPAGVPALGLTNSVELTIVVPSPRSNCSSTLSMPYGVGL